jgi:HD-GYP domain-containing protein (c-di-GMP phosphodiesterase class II)
MIIGFATLVEYKNHVTGGHIKRTAAYCELIGKELKKEGKYSDIIDDTFIETLKSVAPLHDIGKLTIPDDVLDKPGKLTDEEFALIKTHTLKGAEIIDLTLNTGKTNQYYEMAKEVTMYHHEKWDGSGYPRGKKGQDIPLSARIMAVSDFFDALSTERPYKKAFPMEKTFKIMKEESGRHFDPVVLEAFFNVVDEAIELHEKMKDENLTEINDLNQF